MFKNELAKKLSELMNELPNYPFETITFTVADDIKFKFMEDLVSKLKQEYQNTNTMDGIRIDFENGWVLLRCSNTGPKARLYVEGKKQQDFNELKNKFTKIINEEIEKCKQ